MGALLQFLDDLRMVMPVTGGSDLLLRHRFRGINILLHKGGEPVLELAHLGRGCKIHSRSPLRMRLALLTAAPCDDSCPARACQGADACAAPGYCVGLIPLARYMT